MKTPVVKTEDVFRGKKTITVPATFTEDAHEELMIFYQYGLKQGSWDLDEPHFIGWMSALGVVGCNQGNTQNKDKDKRISELEAELQKLKKAKK